jgi:hypothetical protein
MFAKKTSSHRHHQGTGLAKVGHDGDLEQRVLHIAKLIRRREKKGGTHRGTYLPSPSLIFRVTECRGANLLSQLS